MTIRILLIAAPRSPEEEVWIGTVRCRRRGIPESEFPWRDFCDVRLPEVATRAELVRAAQKVNTEQTWAGFARTYRADTIEPDASRLLDVLAWEVTLIASCELN